MLQQHRNAERVQPRDPPTPPWESPPKSGIKNGIGGRCRNLLPQNAHHYVSFFPQQYATTAIIFVGFKSGTWPNARTGHNPPFRYRILPPYCTRCFPSPTHYWWPSSNSFIACKALFKGSRSTACDLNLDVRKYPKKQATLPARFCFNKLPQSLVILGARKGLLVLMKSNTPVVDYQC